MDYIKIKERKDIFKLGILDENDNPVLDENGKEVCLEFDLGDIDLPFRYDECLKKVSTAKTQLKTTYLAIDKKKDTKSKNALMTSNQKKKMEALKKFYSDMEEAMDLFLGEGGTRKYLNGKKPYLEMFDDLSEAIEPFLPKMQLTLDDMKDRIKSKYKSNEEGDILRDD